MNEREIAFVFIGVLITGVVLVICAGAYDKGREGVMNDISKYGCDKVVEVYNKMK